MDDIQYLTIDELANVNEILVTLNEMSDDARMMIGKFNLYDVNGEILGSISFKNEEFVLSLSLVMD